MSNEIYLTPGEKLAQTLERINLDKFNTQKIASQEQKERMTERNRSQDVKNIINSVILIQKGALDNTIKFLNSLKKEAESDRQAIDQIIEQVKQDIHKFQEESLKDKDFSKNTIEKIGESLSQKINSFEKYYSITTRDIKKSINKLKADYTAEFENFVSFFRNETEGKITNVKRDFSALSEKVKFLKINYNDLLNKPRIVQEEEIRNILSDYFKKEKRLEELNQRLFSIEVEKLRKQVGQVKEVSARDASEIKKLSEEQKKLLKEIKDTPASGGYSYGGGYDYFPSLTKVQVVTADYPISSVDRLILANATSSNLTVTLPKATKTGLVLAITKTDSSSNIVTISKSGADTIEGATSVVLTSQYTTRWLVADGATTWYVIASGTGGGGTIEVPTGDVDGVNLTFTVNNTPRYVIVDGLYRRSGKGYTYAGGTITVDSLTPPNYDIFSIY